MVYKMGLPVFSWEGVNKYDWPWQGKLFIKWVCQFFLGGCGQIRWAWQAMWFIQWICQFFPGRVWANTMGLGQGKWFIKWVCQFFSWERVNKDDGQGEVYKMRRSNLCVLCIFVVFFSTVVVSNTSLKPLGVCMGLPHFQEPALN